MEINGEPNSANGDSGSIQPTTPSEEAYNILHRLSSAFYDHDLGLSLQSFAPPTPRTATF
jgi:hypothetical protein